MSGKMQKEIKRPSKHKRVITVVLGGKEFPIELDTTPGRHNDEPYDIYKERQRHNAHLLKMAKKEYVFKSKTYMDEILGIAGSTAVRDENGELVKLEKQNKDGEDTINNGNANVEGRSTDTKRTGGTTSL